MVKAGPFNIELVPATSWGKSLYKLTHTRISRRYWDDIRARELRRAGSKCEICGDSSTGLTCHEKWEYDETRHIQKLVGYEITCRDCSNVLYLGRASTDEFLWKAAVKQFTYVTGLKEKDLKAVFDRVMDEWNERSHVSWHIDISEEPLLRAYEDELNKMEPSRF